MSEQKQLEEKTYTSSVLNNHQYTIKPYKNNNRVIVADCNYPMYPYSNFEEYSYEIWSSQKSGWVQTDVSRSNWNGSGYQDLGKQRVSKDMIDKILKQIPEKIKEIEETKDKDDKDIIISDFVQEIIEDVSDTYYDEDE